MKRDPQSLIESKYNILTFKLMSKMVCYKHDKQKPNWTFKMWLITFNLVNNIYKVYTLDKLPVTIKKNIAKSLFKFVVYLK